VTVVVWDNVPLAPLIVRVNVPRGAERVVETLIVELPEPVTLDGLNEAVTPLGKPLTLRLTVPENPATEPTDTVYVVELPRFTDRELGDALIVKSGVATGLTTSVT